MGDETWCFAYDPETKRQSSEWVGETSTWLKKLKFQRSCIKTILIIFFNSQGIVHKEFVPEGKTVNAFIGFVQLWSALEIFPCCMIMRLPTKLEVFANFCPQKC
jgi:hypothetical protein